MKLKQFFRVSNIWKAPVSSIVGGICVLLAIRNIYVNMAVTMEDIALIGIGITGGGAPDPAQVKHRNDDTAG
jgi:hypothetical protein